MPQIFFIIFILLSVSQNIFAKCENRQWCYIFGDSISDNWLKTPSPIIERAASDPQTITLKTRLPDSKIIHPAIFIDDIYQSAQIYINDSIIYSFGKLTENNSSSSRVWHIINLPSDYSNREITFLIKSDRSKIGVSEYILIDSAENIYQKILRKDLFKLICAAFLIMFFCVTFFLVIYLKQFAYLGLCGFILFIGIWVFANQHLSQIYFNYPTMLYYMDIPSLMFAVACYFYYFKQVVIDRYRRISFFIQNLFLSIAVLSIILDFFTPVKITDMLRYYIALLLFASIVLIYILLKKPLKNQQETKVFLIGMISCLTLAALETIFYLFELNPTVFGLSFSFLHIGTVLLVLSWAIMLITRYVSAYNNYTIAHDVFSKKTLEVQNEERKRIAADLHDAIGHDFLVIRTLAETGKMSADRSEALLAEISKISEQGVNNVRTVCRSLYPPVLENIGLTQALKSLVKRSFTASEIELHSNIEEIDSYFDKTDYIHIYRVMQEIINNIIKHSSANQVQIEFLRQAKQIVLEVTDNGKGIEQSTLNSIPFNYNNFGLSGILERVKILKGIVEINNNLPSGLVIKITLPINFKG